MRWFDDVCNVGRPLVARPSPATARGHRTPGPVGQVCGCLKPPSPLRVPAEPRLKPLSPLRVPAEPRLKPPSPLRVRNGRFWRVFRAQRRCRFQGSPVGGEQWCWWFQCRHLVAPRARKSSPCALKMAQNGRFLACWASFFAEEPLEGPCWASFFAPIGPAPRSCRRRGARGWLRWGVLQH